MSFANLPAEAVEPARMGFSDCIGVMYAGRDEDAHRILAATLAPASGDSELCFAGCMATVPEAAWINGAAAYPLDFDDVAIGGYPGTVLVPAILAEVQHLGLTGEDMLRAYVVGFEAWADLSLREHGSLHGKGWHPTGI